MDARTKYINPDFRRDLKDGQLHRLIKFDIGVYAAIHSEDWHLTSDALHIGKIGTDCARRLGVEWSKPPP